MKKLGKQQTKQDFKGGDKERLKELKDAISLINELWYSPASEVDIENAIKYAMQIANGKDK